MNKQQLNTDPTEMKSHSEATAHTGVIPSIHDQPVLVRWGPIEVVFELSWKRGLRLITVQATPLLRTAGSGEEKSQHQTQALQVCSQISEVNSFS